MVMPTVANIPTAAMPIPYRPADSCATKIAAQITRTGRAQLRNPTAKPSMMLVAVPIREASAISMTGFMDV